MEHLRVMDVPFGQSGSLEDLVDRCFMDGLIERTSICQFAMFFLPGRVAA